MVSPPEPMHGLIVGEIVGIIRDFVRRNKSALVFAECGFLMQKDPRELRAPDVAFVRRERAAQLDLGDWLPFPPDFAVEVISECDLAIEVQRKIHCYMANGTQLLWEVYPCTRIVQVYRPGEPIQIVGAESALDGGDVLPGFSVTVEDIFAPLEGISPED